MELQYTEDQYVKRVFDSNYGCKWPDCCVLTERGIVNLLVNPSTYPS